MQIETANPIHLPQVLELNEGAVPHVNSLSVSMLETIAGQSRHFLVAKTHENIVGGFTIALDETAEYESPNYRFFRNTYPKFMYVDRIVVRPEYKGQGIGRKLYETLATRASGIPVLTCEVNLRPPNPDSLAFHQRLGFVSVGEQETENGSKRVLLMARTKGSPSVDSV